MTKVVGPSGVVVDAEETIAAGLVRSGLAWYVEDDAAQSEKPKQKRSSKPGGGRGTTAGDNGGPAGPRDRHE